MEKRNKRTSWRVYALTATVWAAAAGLGTWGLFHRERPDGLDVMAALVWLAGTVIWTVRAVRAFRTRIDEKLTTKDNHTDGGDNHD